MSETLTVETGLLSWAWGVALAHVGESEPLSKEGIAGVRVERRAEGDDWRLVATDSLTLVVVNLGDDWPLEDDPGFAVTVKRPGSVPGLLRSEATESVACEFNGDDATWTAESMTLRTPTTDYYPDWRSLLAFKPRPVDGIALNPQLAARVASLAASPPWSGSLKPLTLRFSGDLSPVRFDLGDRVHGLWMPVRAE